jgi:hypothetical protein
VVGAASSALVTTAMAVVAWGAGATVVSVGLTVVAGAIVAIVVVDYPVATEFSATGVVRRCPLRRQHLAWDRVEMLTRSAGATLLRRDRASVDRVGEDGGLVAVVGRRRYLLVNVAESRDECAVVRGRLDAWGVPTRWRAGPPPEHQPPTWMYRRRRWRP